MKPYLLFLLLLWACVSSGSVDAMGRAIINRDSVADIIDSAIGSTLKRPLTDYKLSIEVSWYGGDDLSSLNTYRWPESYTGYVYPASTVKLPLAAAALDYIDRTCGTDTANLFFLPDSSTFCGALTYRHQKISIDELFTQMLVFSNNEMFNRMYDFVGHSYLSQFLCDRNYNNVNIFRRFLPCDSSLNTLTIGGQLIDSTGRIVLANPPLRGAFEQNSHPDGLVGRAHVTNKDAIPGPMSFKNSNRFDVADLHHFLISSVSSPGFISPAARALLIRYLSILPGEVDPARKDVVTNFLYSDSIPSVRYVNIVGRAYGFLTDAVCVTDASTNTLFYITVSGYFDPDEIVGGGNYTYSAEGYPFFEKLFINLHDYFKNKNNNRNLLETVSNLTRSH